MLGEDADLGLGVAGVTTAAGRLVAALDLGEERSQEEESSKDSGENVHLENKKLLALGRRKAFVWSRLGAKSHIA